MHVVYTCGYDFSGQDRERVCIRGHDVGECDGFQKRCCTHGLQPRICKRLCLFFYFCFLNLWTVIMLLGGRWGWVGVFVFFIYFFNRRWERRWRRLNVLNLNCTDFFYCRIVIPFDVFLSGTQDKNHFDGNGTFHLYCV